MKQPKQTAQAHDADCMCQDCDGFVVDDDPAATPELGFAVAYIVLESGQNAFGPFLSDEEARRWFGEFGDRGTYYYDVYPMYTPVRSKRRGRR